MANHNEIGEKGEQLAIRYLKAKGFKILATNYRYRRFEIDIIAEYRQKLIIVEVKTRQNSYLSGPEYTVPKSKQKAIIECASAYIRLNEIDLDTRFDILSIIVNSKGQAIEHTEDAFYPTP